MVEGQIGEEIEEWHVGVVRRLSAWIGDSMDLADRCWIREHWKVRDRTLGCTRIRMLGGESECDI